MQAAITPLIESVFDTLKKKNNYGRTITVKIRNTTFQTITRSKTFGSDVKDFSIFRTVTLSLLENNYAPIGKIRLLGVAVSNLMSERNVEGMQLELDL